MTDNELKMFRSAIAAVLNTYGVELICSDPYESVMFIPTNRLSRFKGCSGAGPTFPDDFFEYPENW